MELLVASEVSYVLLVWVPVLSKDVLDVVLREAVQFRVDSGAVAADESTVSYVNVRREVCLAVDAVRVELIINH
jgi:hypothetical protein